jgi:hypothetical protein
VKILISAAFPSGNLCGDVENWKGFPKRTLR